MTNLRQAAEMALEALQNYTLPTKRVNAIVALRQALDQSPDATKMMGLIPSEWPGLDEPPEQEPVYAFRRKGLDDFCTCTKERYEELVYKPNLFEVTTFYAAPVSVEAAVIAEREACAKVCEKAMIQMNYSEAPYKQCAAAIRGMK